MKLTATVTPANLPDLLAIYHKARIPLFIQGAPGIGKSAITAAFARDVARREGRKFLSWSTATDAEKEAVGEDPSDHFLFYDLRLSMINEADIRGLQLLHNVKDHLRLTPPLWVKAFTHPGASGLLFFDEINIAPEYISAMAYQIIHDRVISDRPLGAAVSILAAGNRVEDAPCLVRELPAPLADRFGQVAMTAGGHAFLDFALRRENTAPERNVSVPVRSENDRALNPIRAEVITVIHQNPALLDKRASDGKLTTERGMERLSRLLDACPEKISADELTRLAQSAVGAEAAAAIVGYMLFRTELDFPAFLNTPVEYAKKKSAANRSVLHALAEMASGYMPLNFDTSDFKTELTPGHDTPARLAEGILLAVDTLPQDAIALFFEIYNSRHRSRSDAFKFWYSLSDKHAVKLPSGLATVAGTINTLRTVS